jgi:hypothetical protein
MVTCQVELEGDFMTKRGCWHCCTGTCVRHHDKYMADSMSGSEVSESCAFSHTS